MCRHLIRIASRVAAEAGAILLAVALVASPVVAAPAQALPSTTSVASSSNPSVYGQAITFTASVPGGLTGSVSFTIDGNPAGNANFSLGTASITVSSLGAGAHAVSAAYSGDLLTSPSSGSLPGGQTVSKAATTTALFSSNNPDTSGGPVIFTATVTPVTPGGGSPTGSVTFASGTTTLGTSTVSGTHAYLTVYTIPLGANTATASYAGDGNFTGSSGSLTQSVTVPITASPTTSASPTAKASPTPSATPKKSPTPSARPSPSSVSATATPTVVPTVTDTSVSPTATPSLASPSSSSSPSTPASKSSSLPLIGLVLLVVAAGAVGAFVYLRRRRGA